MYYYKQVDETGELLLLLTYDAQPSGLSADIVEIAAEEYEALMAEIAASRPGPEPAPEYVSTGELEQAIAEGVNGV